MDKRERKDALPYGAQRKVRRETGYSAGFISDVVAGYARPTVDARKVAVALCRKMRPRRRVDEAFPEYASVRNIA